MNTNIEYKNGYHPFGWGDFWKTGMTAKAARSHKKGYRVDGGYRKTQSQTWCVTEGPHGGVWIKYEKVLKEGE
jgi:hypothetical protein